MGRLTDNILAILGIKPSDRVIIMPKDEVSVQSSIASQNEHSENTTKPQSSDQKHNYTSRSTSAIYIASQLNKEHRTVVVEDGNLNKNLTKEHQIEDCDSCRYVGTATLVGAAAFTAKFGFNKASSLFFGWRRQVFRVQVGLACTSKETIFSLIEAAILGIFAIPPPPLTLRQCVCSQFLLSSILHIFKDLYFFWELNCPYTVSWTFSQKKAVP